MRACAMSSSTPPAARRAPGVRLAIAAPALRTPPSIPLRLDFGVELDAFLQPVLATDRVRYVGEPVAAVVADDPYAAEDAVRLVEVVYEPLGVVLDPLEASDPAAP